MTSQVLGDLKIVYFLSALDLFEQRTLVFDQKYYIS